MTTALEEGEWSASRFCRSLPPGKTWYPLYMRLGGPRGRSGQVRKISLPPGFDDRSVQPVVAIPTTLLSPIYAVSSSLISVWPLQFRIPESLPTKVVNCVVLCIVCVYMCTVLLPPCVNPIAVNKYININPLNPELNPICYLLALLGAHHFLHVSRIRVKSLILRRLMSYIYIWNTHSWCF